jgi:Phytanoyl-CoA dioxygenase (PhyH)
VEKEVARLFADVTRAEFFANLAPALHVDGVAADTPVELSTASAEHAHATLAKHGYFSLDSLVPLPLVEALARALEDLDRAHLSTCFLFAYDEAWSLGFAIADALRAVLGAHYAIAPDVWAWLVRPEKGRSGWRPHRGTYQVERQANGGPRVVNVWLALSDVTVDTACMHVVPLDRDPHYPQDLQRVDFDPTNVTPLTAKAGTLLGWDSNVLHFGGPMTERATSARLSLSYTLRCPADAMDLHRVPNFQDRIDLLAQMVLVYGDQEGPSLHPERRWAAMHEAMRKLGTSARSR